MGLVLRPTGRAPERILAFGAEGAGKTYAWFCVAIKTTGHFYVLDTDMTVDPFLDGGRFDAAADRITSFVPMEFGEALDQAAQWRKEATKDDWLVIDRLDWAWEAAQDEFSDRVFGVDSDEHFLAYREQVEAKKADGKKSSKSPFDGMQDWPTIKKRHARLIKTLLTWPGHVYVTTAEKEVNQDFDDADTFRQYGRIGAKPAGEKKNGHAMRTVLRFQGNNPQTWRVTTVKDRERDQLDGKGVSDFAMDYLKKVAGWKPGSSGGSKEDKG